MPGTGFPDLDELLEDFTACVRETLGDGPRRPLPPGLLRARRRGRAQRRRLDRRYRGGADRRKRSPRLQSMHQPALPQNHPVGAAPRRLLPHAGAHAPDRAGNAGRSGSSTTAPRSSSRTTTATPRSSAGRCASGESRWWGRTRRSSWTLSRPSDLRADVVIAMDEWADWAERAPRHQPTRSEPRRRLVLPDPADDRNGNRHLEAGGRRVGARRPARGMVRVDSRRVGRSAGPVDQGSPAGRCRRPSADPRVRRLRAQPAATASPVTCEM